MKDLLKIHRTVSIVLKEAEEKFKKGFQKKGKVFQKKGIQLTTSTLTKTDQELDALIRDRLRETFPDIGFITEEKEETNSKHEYNWIIDPIDGTANFAHKIPICGISIALWQNDVPVYGSVSFPMLNEMVHSIEGKGIFLNDIPVKRGKQITPTPYTLYSHVGTNEEKTTILRGIIKISPFPADYFCATYQGCLVVLGKADAWIVVNLPIWDIAAILLFAKEVGLHCEFVSKPPTLSDPGFREYKNTFVIGDKKLAIKVAAQIKTGLEATK